MANRRVVVVIGQEYGRLTPIREVSKSAGGHLQYLCRCICGTKKTVIGAKLASGHTQSCGCLHRESVASINRTHGLGSTAEYRIYRNILQRCCNPKNSRYKDYGGRGIQICERWKGENGFVTFLRDMGSRPSILHTIDRKNNDDGYTPKNCKWATKKEQNNNKRTNVMIEFNGVTQTAQQWAKDLRIQRQTILYRHRHGIPIDKPRAKKGLVEIVVPAASKRRGQ